MHAKRTSDNATQLFVSPMARSGARSLAPSRMAVACAGALLALSAGLSVASAAQASSAAPAPGATAAQVTAQQAALQKLQTATQAQQNLDVQAQAQEQAQAQLLNAQLQGAQLQQHMQQNQLQAAAEAFQAQQQTQQLANTLERQKEISQIDNPSMYFLPPLKTPANVRAPIGNMVQQRYPMTSAEIGYALQQARDAQAASMQKPPVTIVNPILHASIGPGGKIPTVRVAPGYMVSLSVVDRNGNAWPITSKSVGGGQQFNVQAPFQMGGKGTSASVSKKPNLDAIQDSLQDRIPDNMLTLTTPSYGTDTNMMLTLKGLQVPVMVHLEGTQPKPGSADGMVTLQIDNADAPDAPKPVVYSVDQGQAPELTQFLEQTPPSSAVALRVSDGAPLQAWEWNGLVVIRSTEPLRSPAWKYEGTLGGVYAYAIEPASVVLVRQPDGSVQDYEITPPPGGFDMSAANGN